VPDAPVFHFAENSPEQLAYQLMRDILLQIENKPIGQIGRKWYLDTYAECLMAVRVPSSRLP
jgi:hypothetical protein